MRAPTTSKEKLKASESGDDWTASAAGRAGGRQKSQFCPTNLALSENKSKLLLVTRSLPSSVATTAEFYLGNDRGTLREIRAKSQTRQTNKVLSLNYEAEPAIQKTRLR